MTREEWLLRCDLGVDLALTRAERAELAALLREPAGGLSEGDLEELRTIRSCMRNSTSQEDWSRYVDRLDRFIDRHTPLKVEWIDVGCHSFVYQPPWNLLVAPWCNRDAYEGPWCASITSDLDDNNEDYATDAGYQSRDDAKLAVEARLRELLGK